ncbi:MAG: bactofilin family protein [Wenyingzhuangia sp.]|jgi:cytoskeletal protein CcmA (bactofilin family)|uniref:bactofilin family protein n=1 Tax=Wenyingzhuangia sp. TaxID=1964193 RepID=UPI00321B9A88
MFNSSKKKSSGLQDDLIMERNKIAKTTTFKGEVVSQGDFRIDGIVEGDLTTTGKIIIGPEGRVQGRIKCVNADIEGFFDGHLEVKNSLCLKPTANVMGEIYMESLTVQPGAIFNANCKMLSTIKELKNTTIEKSEETVQSISEVS